MSDRRHATTMDHAKWLVHHELRKRADELAVGLANENRIRFIAGDRIVALVWHDPDGVVLFAVCA